MKRQIVYPGAIPFDTDLLNAQKNSLEGLGKLAHAILGDGPFVNNLQCTPTAPASMAVQVAPGQIYQLLAIDSGTYGALAADSHPILKQGLLRDPVTLNCPAPTNSGQSINYLVQAQYVDQDGNAALLPYYNSANPAQSLNGPNNNGQAQNTSRDGACVVTIKAGASAPTGSQVTPAVDAGAVGLYVVSVAYGATTVTAANLSTYAGAPFISEKLAAKLSQATADLRYLQITNAVGRLLNVQRFTANGTYTPTPGMTKCIVEVQGGGGAGGGIPATSSSQNAISGGGGSGAYGVGQFTAAQVGANQAVTIGAGGTAVSGGAGGAGGTSSFGALLSAPGGGGCAAGAAYSNTVAGMTGFGAGGALPSGANIKTTSGCNGGTGITTGNGTLSGDGAGSPLFGGGGAVGGTGTTSTPAQNSATIPGGGGSGACYGPSAGTSAPGGNGAAGIVIVWEYA